MHDYLWFLQNMDKFDDFLINKKIKHFGKYTEYLSVLYDYLNGFYQRYRPLDDISKMEEVFGRDFQTKYKEGRLIGWDQNTV